MFIDSHKLLPENLANKCDYYFVINHKLIVVHML